MKKSTKTKSRILENAIEVVAKKGYSASSTKEIAEKAGISEATLFKYYGTKDELLNQIVLKTIDKFHNYSLNEAFPHTFEIAQNQTSQYLIREMIKERFIFFEENFPAFRVIMQEMMVNENIRKIFKEKIWATMESISNQIFDRGKERGELKDINNYFLRKAFFGMLFFSSIFENLLLDEDQKYTLDEQIDSMVDILFNGIKER
ncbi:MAG: TetR/AcrR family transcriptional regulator [Halanaerobiales bacterium]|nr:TetR/AcrR family transcriptional regulator [Halanaerobiales bacterium]